MTYYMVTLCSYNETTISPSTMLKISLSESTHLLFILHVCEHEGPMKLFRLNVNCRLKYAQLEMWASAQRDGHHAKYRWRPLFNTAKFGWRPALDCHAVTLPRRETRWNLLWCPKLPDRSQPLVGWSSPYYQDMWRWYCCLTGFSDCRYVP